MLCLLGDECSGRAARPLPADPTVLHRPTDSSCLSELCLKCGVNSCTDVLSSPAPSQYVVAWPPTVVTHVCTHRCAHTRSHVPTKPPKRTPSAPSTVATCLGSACSQGGSSTSCGCLRAEQVVAVASCIWGEPSQTDFS